VNISTHGYETRPSDPVFFTPESTLASDIEEHHEILGKNGPWVLTGEVALITDPDPSMAGTGALQVWSKTADGMWVFVNPEGEVVEAACPIGD